MAFKLPNFQNFFSDLGQAGENAINQFSGFFETPEQKKKKQQEQERKRLQSLFLKPQPAPAPQTQFKPQPQPVPEAKKLPNDRIGNTERIKKALKDEGILNPETLAYAMATVDHETAGTFQPIEEYGGRQQARRLGYSGGENYFGRGFIQLTHDYNYKEIGRRIGMGDELYKNPDLAKDPDVAAKILAAFFKDKGVASFSSKGDFFNARRPINGVDQAQKIAMAAKQYLPQAMDFVKNIGVQPAYAAEDMMQPTQPETKPPYPETGFFAKAKKTISEGVERVKKAYETDPQQFIYPPFKPVSNFITDIQKENQKGIDAMQKYFARQPLTPDEKKAFENYSMNMIPVGGMTNVGKKKVVEEVSKKVAPSIEEATKYIASKVGREPAGLPPTGVIQKTKNFLGVLKSSLVNAQSPIDDAVDKFHLEPSADPRFLKKRVFGSVDIAKQMMKRELEPIIKSVGSKDLDLFDQYLGTRQALDVQKAGFKTGLDPKKAQVFVDHYAPQFDEAAKQVTAFTQKVLKYVQEGGLINKETYDTLLKKYPRYVPLNRVFDALDEAAKTGPSKKAIGSLSQQTIVQKLRGSERDIKGPLSSIVEKTVDATRQVEQNRVAQSIVNLRNFGEYKDLIKKAGPGAKHTISVFENGQKVIYEVPEEMATAAKNLNKDPLNILTKILAVPVRVARLGFTGLNIPFVATNYVRDQLFATLTTTKVAKTSMANPYNFLKGFFYIIKQPKAYDDFLAAGGGWSTFFQQGRGASVGTVKEMAKGPGGKILTTVTHPSQWLGVAEDIISRGEQATRTQVFKGMRETNVSVDPFAKPTDEALKAMKAGRDVTVDFAEGGAFKGVLNSVFIYLNAGIQGTRTMMRAFKNHPATTSFKLATTLYTPIALATLWNTATPERKAAYQDISDYERDRNIIILPPNPQKDESGNWVDAVKIPLPQGFNALTIPVRTAIEHLADGNPASIPQALMNTLGEALPVDVSSKEKFFSRLTPTAILPGVEDITNTKLFTGTPIVPRSKENLPPEMQTRFDTSGFLKRVGEVLNYSPAKLQNYVQSFSGGVGLQVLNAIDHGLAAAGIISQDEIGGRGLWEDVKQRFAKASVGKKEEQFFKGTQDLREQAAVRSDQEKTAAESIYGELQNLPKDQWRAKLSELKKGGILNERIYDRIVELDKDQSAGGITKEDKSIRGLPVEERSQYILKEVSKLDPSEQRAYLSGLKKKRILTEPVYNRLIELGYEIPQ